MELIVIWFTICTTNCCWHNFFFLLLSFYFLVQVRETFHGQHLIFDTYCCSTSSSVKSTFLYTSRGNFLPSVVFLGSTKTSRAAFTISSVRVSFIYLICILYSYQCRMKYKKVKTNIETVNQNLRLINGRFPTLSKGQIISKAIFIFLISPKKRTKEIWLVIS